MLSVGIVPVASAHAMPAPPRRRPKQARSRETVDVILEAAAQVLTEFGPEGATTNRIAERAGVSVGSLYQYFSNKKALYTALGERFLGNLRATVVDLAGVAPQLPLDRLLPSMIDALFSQVVADPLLHGMLHVTAVPPRDFEIISLFERELEQLTAMLLQTHPLLRAACPNPTLSAKVLVRACAGLSARTLAQEPELIATPAFRDELVRLIDGYLGGVLSRIGAPP